MSTIERLLIPGSTDLPECRCGGEMEITSVDPLFERRDAEIRIYICGACKHEMRLTVWTDSNLT